MTKFTIEIGPMGALWGKIDGVPFERKGISLDKLELLERMLATVGIEVEYTIEHQMSEGRTKFTLSNIHPRKQELV